MVGARYTCARREKWGRRGTTRREEAERFIFGEERGETRGQFSCAVMLAKFAQLKRVEAEEEEEENCTRVENFTKFAAKLCTCYVYIYIKKRNGSTGNFSFPPPLS